MKPRVVPVTRESAYARGFDGIWIHRDFNHRKARQLFEMYPHAVVVDFTRPTWNTSAVRYRPEPLHIIYVKSTGGGWGKSARMIPDPNMVIRRTRIP